MYNIEIREYNAKTTVSAHTGKANMDEILNGSNNELAIATESAIQKRYGKRARFLQNHGLHKGYGTIIKQLNEREIQACHCNVIANSVIIGEAHV